MNRLAQEKSPYLLQHAANPVDWLPWGPEAFEKARREDKPIFLSIGYSTCHWCHVMERESFSNVETAALLNGGFVPVKVDREERPDVDRIYMTAVQAMTGQGGWPLSVWLTPELKPFFGGTYFPPRGQWGRPGFPEILERIAELWRTQREKIAASSGQLADFLAQAAQARPSSPPPGGEVFARGLAYYESSYDPSLGGFGGAPKFPMPVHHNFLLRCADRLGPSARTMSLETLRRMADGGLFDHLGGGFHRYSTDERWHVPHFEKMLYDNAQLAVVYVEAYQASRDEAFARTARRTLDYVLRDLARPGGGFYSAEDADSLPPELGGKAEDAGHEQRKEGAFYVWEKAEILKILGPEDGALFCRAYGVREDGNALEDPHGEFIGKNILYRAEGSREAALEPLRAKLLAARSRRPRPLLDDKILCSWNGLMLSALAKAAQALEEPLYLDAARKTADFLRASLYDAAQGRLYRRWRAGERKVPGTADDYAFLIQGLLDLFEADFDASRLDWAVELSDQARALFFDEASGSWFMTAAGDDPALLVRSREDADNVEPSAASVGALNLLRLAELTGRAERGRAAEKVFAQFARQLAEQPQSLPYMLTALDFALRPPRQIVVAGKPEAEDTRALLRQARRPLLPRKTLLLADGGPGQAALTARLPFLKGMAPVGGRAAAYVCEHFACKAPVTDPAALARLLKEGG